MADNSAQIQADSEQPAEAAAGSLSARQHSIPDKILADRYSAAVAARKSARRGACFTKLIPAGAMPDQQGTGFGGLSSFESPGGIP